MTNSPFKNFDPEVLSTRAVINRPIASSHAVTDLLRRAVVAVSGSNKISNHEITKFIEYVAEYSAPAEPRRVSFTDIYSDYPAHLQLVEGITAQQYHAARALMLLDETLDILNADGWSANVADRLVLAAAWVSDANEKSADNSKWRAVIDGERKTARLESAKVEVEASREMYAFFRVQERTPTIIKAARVNQTASARAANLCDSSPAKKRGLKICTERAWKDRGEAKRHIAMEESRAESTVNNWISEWLGASLIKPFSRPVRP